MRPRRILRCIPILPSYSQRCSIADTTQSESGIRLTVILEIVYVYVTMTLSVTLSPKEVYNRRARVLIDASYPYNVRHSKVKKEIDIVLKLTQLQRKI